MRLAFVSAWLGSFLQQRAPSRHFIFALNEGRTKLDEVKWSLGSLTGDGRDHMDSKLLTYRVASIYVYAHS